MAMSFVLPGNVDSVDVEFEAAFYQHFFGEKETGKENEKYIAHYYKRQPLKTGRITVFLGENGGITIGDEIILRSAFRRKYRDGSCLWTVSVEESTAVSS